MGFEGTPGTPSITLVFYPNLLIYTKTDSLVNLFFVNKHSTINLVLLVLIFFFTFAPQLSQESAVVVHFAVM
jgi:hypothetical protein